MKSDALREEWELIRRQFFPRWDRERRWQIKVVSDLHGTMGRCCPEERTIYLACIPQGVKGRLLLIHEIAHAVTASGHGKKWQRRMARAALRAEQLGFYELADAIRNELQNPEEPRAQLVYNQIQDLVQARPEIQFSQLVEYLRRQYGLSRADFLRRFRKAQEVYREAQSWVGVLKAQSAKRPSPENEAEKSPDCA